MKNLLALLFAVGVVSGALAQQKLLTMEDAMVKNRTSLAVENLRQLQFVFGTEDYVYLKKDNVGEVWMRGNAKGMEAMPFLSLSRLNDYARRSAMDTFQNMPAIQFNKSANWVIDNKGVKWLFRVSDSLLTPLIDKNIAAKEHVEESSAGMVVFVNNNNLFVKNGGSTRQVTTDGSIDIVYASSVHRDEFGISKGTFWSNDGRKLAYYRMDQTMVTDYPIIDWSVRPAKVNNIKYPMAGNQSHQVTVWVFDPVSGLNLQLQTGGPGDQYLTNVAWSPDDKYVFIAVLNRAQDHMWLNQYDASTGAFVKTLFEEKDAKYVEPLVPMLFVKNNPNQFIWQSNRDGWNHLYLYNTDGSLVKQLTTGTWEVLEVKGFDEKGEQLYYISNETSPINRDLYCLQMKNGKTKRITNGIGVHTTQLSGSGNYTIDAASSTANPRQIQLIETATGKATTLLQAKHPLADYALGKMEVFTLTAADGLPLYCRMFKPTEFDSTKQYPVVVYWYGGPHNQLITAGFNGGAGDYWFQYMAERGYVVFSMDVHGSDNRGKAFEQSIFRQAGKAQAEDLMVGVKYLQNLPFVKRDNMGLFGWSYGGFNTMYFMLNYPGVFKAAVAGGPVTDWSLYEIMYGERYMDTPQENPEGYANTDLSKQVEKLKGKLLIIHGLQDPVVVQQHSVKFVKSAVDKNVQVDYMIYPGHEHNVLGKDRAHLYQKVTDYLEQWLK